MTLNFIEWLVRLTSNTKIVEATIIELLKSNKNSPGMLYTHKADLFKNIPFSARLIRKALKNLEKRNIVYQATINDTLFYGLTVDKPKIYS